MNNDQRMQWLQIVMDQRDQMKATGRGRDAQHFARLAVWLESHADEDGRVTISNSHLRQKASQTAPAFRGNMATLRNLGLLTTLPYLGQAGRQVHQLTVPSTVGVAHAYA